MVGVARQGGDRQPRPLTQLGLSDDCPMCTAISASCRRRSDRYPAYWIARAGRATTGGGSRRRGAPCRSDDVRPADGLGVTAQRLTAVRSVLSAGTLAHVDRNSRLCCAPPGCASLPAQQLQPLSPATTPRISHALPAPRRTRLWSCHSPYGATSPNLQPATSFNSSRRRAGNPEPCSAWQRVPHEGGCIWWRRGRRGSPCYLRLRVRQTLCEPWVSAKRACRVFVLHGDDGVACHAISASPPEPSRQRDVQLSFPP
jgi:hypothetical protein